jgi:hypothetical protein
MLTVSKRRKGCPFGKLSAAGISVQFGRTSSLVHGSGENALAMLELLKIKPKGKGRRARMPKPRKL